MKFDALFLGRIHYQDKDYREKNKLMEVVWKTSDSIGIVAFLMSKNIPQVNFKALY